MQTFLSLRSLNVLRLSTFWHQGDFSLFLGGDISTFPIRDPEKSNAMICR